MNKSKEYHEGLLKTNLTAVQIGRMRVASMYQNHKTLEDVEEVSLKIQYKDSDGFYRIDVEDFLTELEKLKL